ncbi:ribonuclease P protein subunit p38 [Sorex fumeus]|uniref:ribonuclease P protein subunit p38 n=1 Tax=Sorex fumeus TaxID=62283 RepID=UPI0024AD5436|nr:ribonuclease P protein subunit p38 [Sorex fumeus]
MAAAPQAPARGSVRKSRPVMVKTSLNNPYVMCWGTLEREDAQFILQSLEDRLRTLGLRKVEDKRRKRKQPGAARPGPEPSGPEEVASGWTPAHVRKQLALGINEVTRALERAELRLALVCRSAQPARITAHLIQLSASRAVPAGQVPRLSQRLAPVLSLKCVLALGFRTHSPDFEEQVKAITPRLPPVTVPWLPGTLEGDQENVDMASSESKDKEGGDRAQEDALGPKRKLPEGPQAIVLQPLRIKKVIPNPNKIRKPPKSKKTTSK